MPRGGPGLSKRRGSGGAFAGPRGECAHCQLGKVEAPCTCFVQDRCSEVNPRLRRQCILGAGHTLKHVDAAGNFWE